MSATEENCVPCPVCDRKFRSQIIEDHVNKCLFLNSQTLSTKRSGSHLDLLTSPQEKRVKLANSKVQDSLPSSTPSSSALSIKNENESIPLAERMRPTSIDELVGQKESFGPGSMLRSMIEKKKVPNMILWGPPGCGKTSMANVISAMCKEVNNLRFVKLSATMAGINDVKEVVKVARNENQYKRQTVLFMDEIHRFNKLQQDSFLPHVENGTIILIGATTENPSFSLNNALLSRCRVVVMQKLTTHDVMVILKRALERNKQAVVVDTNGTLKTFAENDCATRCVIEGASLRWLAEMCDGDARFALSALELTLTSLDPGPALSLDGPALLTLDHIKDGIKRSHVLYDRQGEEHYNVASAIHKSIRASDDNAALYWTTRALEGGEDPIYVARRLVRAACEDIGLAEPNALVEAVSCLHGCQNIGMPECNVLLAQCAVRLARAPKCTEVYHAMKRCQRAIRESKGPMPSVPLHLRNAPTKLMKQLGYGKGYNTSHKDESGFSYMPEGMEDVNFFQNDD